MGGTTSEPTDASVGDAVVAPPTQDENLLYTRAGKACSFQDANEFAWRIRQLEIINWAVQVLSKELCKNTDAINYKWLTNTAMTYQDVDGNPSDEHDWTIIANDVTFRGPSESENQFSSFANYMARNQGAHASDMYRDMTNYLVIFIRLRNALIQKMSSSCQ